MDVVSNPLIERDVCHDQDLTIGLRLIMSRYYWIKKRDYIELILSVLPFQKILYIALMNLTVLFYRMRRKTLTSFINQAAEISSSGRLIDQFYT